MNTENLLPKKPLILVIDDDVDILDLSVEIFQIKDYEVLTAASGEEAFAVLDKVTKLDLILLDLNMKGMGGAEFLLELEKKRPDILATVPVVFLTGMNKVPVGKVVGLIRKPFTLDQILNAADKFMGMGVSEETQLRDTGSSSVNTAP